MRPIPTAVGTRPAARAGGDHRARLTFERARLLAGGGADARLKLLDLAAVERMLRESPGARLVRLDARSERRVLAAVAVGDLGMADFVSVTVGGLNTNAFDAVGGMAREAHALRDEAAGLASAAGRAGTVAAVGWLGYRAPDTEAPRPLRRIRGVLEVSLRGRARGGAPALAEFYRGLRRARPWRRIVAVGHPYGSLVTSYALRQLPAGVVDAAIFYGSAGLDLHPRALDDPGSLAVPTGAVYAMRGDTDWIRHLAGNGLPGDPVRLPWIRRLGTDAARGPADGLAHGAARNHADYPRSGSNGVISIAGHNVAAVLIGRPDLATIPAGSRSTSL